ncbi:MAG: glycosyltransferase family 2 protein [Proteobacteria bacterium]|jgi:cellulose synthase/poly-beta-1,6-N-acetylglucosamine synthase-like glycosyltransferase|nr:glycosyltransferase family 2 protein [Pseudomonadota bacterium]
MSAVLVFCAVLTALLATYSLGHYFCAAVFLTSRRHRRSFGFPEDSVAVLIPARNEGERAMRAINSLLAQDHRGPIEIHLLVKDEHDTAIPLMQKSFPNVDFSLSTEQLCQVTTDSERSVFVAYVGVDPKSDKVNWIASRTKAHYTAILDADHQAHSQWLRSSICLLQQHKARIVQGRRQPISARGFFQLWDSLHQHIGCELFNTAFTRLGLNVFFTGTTVVMETELLQSHPFSSCITEDTDFSYDIFLHGERIINNPFCGSDEATSPDLYSFLARRRRWANGHTESFFRHLPSLFQAPISRASRLQFLFHGAHYLISLVVFLLHLAIGVVFFAELSTISIIGSLVSALILSNWVAETQGTIGRLARLAELVVIFGWIYPAIVILMNFSQAALMNDFTRAVLPIPAFLQVMGLAAFFAPLVILVVGLAGFKQLGIGSFLVTIITYLLAFYLDLCGVLLGMVDYFFGRARWRPISREQREPGGADPAKLLPAKGIKDSWRMGPAFSAARRLLPGVQNR